MFEAGIELKQKYGADQVCDFTLGNPDLPPVPQVAKTLRELARRREPAPVAGLYAQRGPALRPPAPRRVPGPRAAGASGGPTRHHHLRGRRGASTSCSAPFSETRRGGHLPVLPYFVEYGFYVGNFAGKLVPVPVQTAGFLAGPRRHRSGHYGQDASYP